MRNFSDYFFVDVLCLVLLRLYLLRGTSVPRPAFPVMRSEAEAGRVDRKKFSRRHGIWCVVSWVPSEKTGIEIDRRGQGMEPAIRYMWLRKRTESMIRTSTRVAVPGLLLCCPTRQAWIRWILGGEGSFTCVLFLDRLSSVRCVLKTETTVVSCLAYLGCSSKFFRLLFFVFFGGAAPLTP